jgi:hypothetical protein
MLVELNSGSARVSPEVGLAVPFFSEISTAIFFLYAI